MPSRIDHEIRVLNAKGATGVDNTVGVDVSEYRHITVSIDTDGGGDAALTTKCQGSISETSPTWTSAASVTNRWDFVAMHDYQDGALLSGDTGFVVASADDHRIFTVNTDGLKWINFRVTARSAGEVTVYIRGFNNS